MFSLPPSLSPSLPPSLPPSLSPSLPLSLPLSLFFSLFFLSLSICTTLLNSLEDCRLQHTYWVYPSAGLGSSCQDTWQDLLHWCHLLSGWPCNHHPESVMGLGWCRCRYSSHTRSLYHVSFSGLLCADTGRGWHVKYAALPLLLQQWTHRHSYKCTRGPKKPLPHSVVEGRRANWWKQTLRLSSNGTTELMSPFVATFLVLVTLNWFGRGLIHHHFTKAVLREPIMPNINTEGHTLWLAGSLPVKTSWHSSHSAERIHYPQSIHLPSDCISWWRKRDYTCPEPSGLSTRLTNCYYVVSDHMILPNKWHNMKSYGSILSTKNVATTHNAKVVEMQRKASGKRDTSTIG